MKKSDLYNSDNIRDWVEVTGKDRAPDGFTQNVMSQINVEPVYSSTFYSNPISKTFKIGALIFVSVIVVLTITMPDSQSSILPNLNFDFLHKFFTNNISFPEIDISSIPYINYLSYAFVIGGLLVALDRGLSWLFTDIKKEKAQQ